MRERGIDLQRLSGLLQLLLLAEVFDRPHVVEPVGELDQDHALVPDHRGDHLSVVLGLRLLAALEVDSRQLGDAFDELRDLVAELRPHLVDLRIRILDHVVQERGGDGLLVLSQLREDLRGAPRVANERFTGAALLSLVRGRGEAKRPREQLAIDVGVVGLDVREQLIEQFLMLLAGFEDGHGKSVLRRFRMTSFRERTRDLTLEWDSAAARVNRATSLPASQAMPQMTSFRERTRDLTLEWDSAAARVNRATSLPASQAMPQVTSFAQAASASVGASASRRQNVGDSRRCCRLTCPFSMSSSAKIAAASGGHAAVPSRQSAPNQVRSS